MFLMVQGLITVIGGIASPFSFFFFYNLSSFCINIMHNPVNFHGIIITTTCYVCLSLLFALKIF